MGTYIDKIHILSMHAMKPGAAALCLLLLCACSAAPKVDWEHGAHRAWVVAAYPPGRNADLPLCLVQLSDSDLATRHFVALRYRHVRTMRTAVAEVPEGLALPPDTQVELWPADCARGQLSRISTLLPPSLE